MVVPLAGLLTVVVRHCRRGVLSVPGTEHVLADISLSRRLSEKRLRLGSAGVESQMR